MDDFLSDRLHLSNDGRIAIYVMAVVWSLTTILSLFGFLGVLFKWRRCVTAFSALTWLQMIASLGTGSYFIYTLFHNKEDANKCANDTASDLEHETCRSVIKVSKVFVIVLYIVIWIIMIWAASIVSDYVGQLREEESAVSEYETRVQMPQQQAPILVVEQMPTTYAPYTSDPASKNDKPYYAV
ncbi:hypothetical protein EWM64_g1640 [Hericium alpestre]|uniref:Uncharacterized protein n=1 Tax=Hericium alpestre TaxID=135208 RepID=A0A4Z0A7A5_9AGAM|nr:hypothetical protein EWM64_g1640 [Hericium alpestre]